MRFRSLLFAVLICGYSHATELTGRLVGVHDGDTITVLDAGNTQNKIRLSGIDAPELKQAFGSKSTQNVSDLVYRKQVTVVWSKRDRYGRIIGKVLFLPESCISPACVEKTGTNYQQVAAGMAWHYKQYEREQ